jgi:hypothetical protein
MFVEVVEDSQDLAFHREEQMAILKARLNRAERRQYLASVKELQAAGLDVAIPQEWKNESVYVSTKCRLGSVVSDVENGAVAYAICVRVVARHSRVILMECRIKTEWDTPILVPACKWRGQNFGGVDYPDVEVLNEQIEAGLRLRCRGDMAQGLILASGRKPIPDNYRSLTSTRLELTFVDQFDEEITKEGELFVVRSASPETEDASAKMGPYEPRENPQPSAIIRDPDAVQEYA